MDNDQKRTLNLLIDALNFIADSLEEGNVDYAGLPYYQAIRNITYEMANLSSPPDLLFKDNDNVSA